MKILERLSNVIRSYEKCLIIGNLEEADKLSVLEMANIRKHLEVLKIIKNKKPNIRHIWLSRNFDDYYHLYERYRDIRPNEYLTKEEFKKIKQWLEVNG